MARFTASPDEIAAVASHCAGDAELLRGLVPALSAGVEGARCGTGGGHGRLAAAIGEFGRVQSVALSALADAAEILTEGFAGAAGDYRDAEVRAAALVRRGAGG